MDDTERIKQSLPIEDVIAGYIELEPAGQYLKGSSPFSNDSDPSFYVSPEKGLYHCKSTNQGGDVFTFIQKMEGVDFRGALELLADRAGIELESSDSDHGETKRLREIVESAAGFYEKKLRESDEAKTYLQSRGITGETAKRFRLGYAPDEWRTLRSHLEKAGFTTSDIEKAGLIKTSDNSSSHYDRFRNRLLFPLADTSGRIVAFSGRRLDESQPGKYINSPETSIFHKSEVLFGYDRAKSALRENDHAILVEGQTDLVLAHQAGFSNTVASSGTAITKDQLKLVQRFTDEVVLALDTDSAGRRAATKTTRLALGLGMNPKIANLPQGSDPADIVHEEGEDFGTYIDAADDAAVTIVDWLEDMAEDREQFLRFVEDTVLPLIAGMEAGLPADHKLEQVAKRAGVRESTLRKTLEKSRNTPDRFSRNSSGVPDEKAARSLADPLQLQNSRLQKIEKNLAATITALHSLDEPGVDVDSLKERVMEINKKRGKSELPDVEKSTVFSKEVSYNKESLDENKKREIEELVLHFEIAVLQSLNQDLQVKLKSVDEKGQRKNLLAEYQDNSSRLETLKDQLRELG